MSHPMSLGNIMLRAIETENFANKEIVNSVSEIVFSEIVVSTCVEDSDARASNQHQASTDIWGRKTLRGDESWDIERFDSLSTEMFSDPLFVWVVDTWKTLPHTLYHECHRLGIDRVRAEINRVRKMRGLRSPGAYLRKSLGRLTRADES